MTEQKCFYVDETMHTANGYVPAMVTEGEPGYSPMIGSGELSQPWYWGHDITVAKQLCDEANEKLGVSPARAREIVQSSITQQIKDDAAQQEKHDRWEAIKKGRPTHA